MRFCIDYRKLNSVTFKDAYRLLQMDECWTSRARPAHFFTFDAYSGIAKSRSAVGTSMNDVYIRPWTVQVFLRVPFGLKNDSPKYVPARNGNYTVSCQLAVCVRNRRRYRYLLEDCRRTSDPSTHYIESTVETRSVIQTENPLLP